MRPLFSDAPVVQHAQMMPAQPASSGLAAALAGRQQPLNLQPVSFGNIPLASMMQAMKGNGVQSTDPNLAWNPNNPVGTDSLNPNTVNRGDAISNAYATYGPGFSQMPQQGAQAAPYQPTADDLQLMQKMQQAGALAPQYQGMLTGGMPGAPPMTGG